MRKISALLCCILIAVAGDLHTASADSNPNSGIVMYPSEDSFVPLGATWAAGDPYPFATNSKDSFISFRAYPSGGKFGFRSLTPEICSNFVPWSSPLAAKTDYTKVSFSTFESGTCSVEVSNSIGSNKKASVFNFPVADWPIKTDQQQIIINLQKSYGVQQPGFRTEPISVSFSYGNPRNSTFTNIAPISVQDATPAVCNVMPDGTVYALGVGLGNGDCVIYYSWPSFSFSNRKFSAGGSGVTVFTVTLKKPNNSETADNSSAPSAQEIAAAKAIVTAKKRAIALAKSRCPKYESLRTLKNTADNAAQNSISLARSLQLMEAKKLSMGSMWNSDPIWAKSQASLNTKFAGSIGTWKAFYNAATSAIRRAGTKCISAVGMPNDSLMYYANQYHLP